MTMLTSQTHRRLSSRRIAALVVLCLFALRGIFFVGAAVAITANHTDNPVFTHAVLGDQCMRKDGSEAPASGPHLEHCLLCTSLARDIVAVSALFIADALLLSSNEQIPLAPWVDHLRHLAKASGMITNWSATSPPRGAKSNA